MTDFDNGLKSTPQAETLMSNLVSGERCWENVGGGILGSCFFIEPHVGNENERYLLINRFQDYPKQSKTGSTTLHDAVHFLNETLAQIFPYWKTKFLKIFFKLRLQRSIKFGPV